MTVLDLNLGLNEVVLLLHYTNHTAAWVFSYNLPHISEYLFKGTSHGRLLPGVGILSSMCIPVWAGF